MSGLFEVVMPADANASDEHGARDFDFFHGAWQVTHRRLRKRLAGNTEWDVFDGFNTCKPILGGLGNIDDNLIELPTGAYRAATLRLFDPTARRWSIWWADGRYGSLDTPVAGGFKDGVGSFFSDDVFEGRPIKVRFTSSEIEINAAKWAQAFSNDDGATWETNWEMRFARRSKD